MTDEHRRRRTDAPRGAVAGAAVGGSARRPHVPRCVRGPLGAVSQSSRLEAVPGGGGRVRDRAAPVQHRPRRVVRRHRGVRGDRGLVGHPDRARPHPEPRRTLHPGGVHWWTESDEDDPDPEFHTHTRLYADRHPWRHGCFDELLRAVADDALAGVFVTDTGLQRVHHPYDGGADVILTTPAERDLLRAKHADWLSSRPSGL